MNKDDEESEYMSSKIDQVCSFATEHELLLSIRDLNEQKLGEHLFTIVDEESLPEVIHHARTLEVIKRIDIEDINPKTVIETLVLLRDFVDKNNFVPVNIR